MFLLNEYSATVLLFVASRSLVIASTSGEGSNEKSLVKTLLNSMQFAYTEGMDSVKSYSGSSCAREITTLSTAIRAEELWALKMLDSSSKIQPGILQGNVKDFGMYGECIGIDEEYQNVTVRGKHCMVELDFNDLQLTSSICIPSSCNETQASQIVSFVQDKLSLNSSLESRIKTTRTTCTKAGSEDFTLGEILTLTFFSAVTAFLLACTVCDYLRRSWPERTSSATVNTLAEFSLYTSALSILDTRMKPGMMPAVNGIRFLSTCWIVGLHQNALLSMLPFVDPSAYRTWPISIIYIMAGTGTLAVDNFFFLSGFLMTYFFRNSMRDGNKFNFLKFYIHRFVRLTPSVAALMLFVTVLFHRLGTGPLWKKACAQFLGDRCRRNWWHNLLYVQNFLSESDICLLHTWFLAADMQLFLLSPFVLYPLHRWPKYGLGLLSLFLIASLVTPPVVLGLNGYTVVGRTFPDPSRFYIRAFPYLMGNFLSYQLASPKRHLGQMTVVLNWIVSCLLLTFCFVAMNCLFSTELGDSSVFQIVCAALLQPFWTIALSWVIYACTQGYGGVLTRFLSLPIFLPLSRLSYSIYLVHVPIIFLSYGTAAIPSIYSSYEIFHSYLGIMVVSIAVSVVTSLLFEIPMIVLEKILKSTGDKRGNSTAMKSLDPSVHEQVENSLDARSEA